MPTLVEVAITPPEMGASSYSQREIVRLAEILRRAGRAVSVDRGELESDLLGLLEAVGRTDNGTEFGIEFRRLSSAGPSHAELAKQFHLLSAADNPLDPRLYSGTVAAELNAKARLKWSSRTRRRRLNRPHPICGTRWELLSEDDQGLVREMTRELARYHQSFVRREAPTKVDQDTLVAGLADIFIDFARMDCGRYELPHAERSHFIRFAHCALRPFFGSTEVSAKSLSRRWQRLKEAATAST